MSVAAQEKPEVRLLCVLRHFQRIVLVCAAPDRERDDDKPCLELNDDEERRLLAVHMPRGTLRAGDPSNGKRVRSAGVRRDSDPAGEYFRHYQDA